MWTLVLWFVLLPADLRAVRSVPGFVTKNACEAAGPHIGKALLDSAKDDRARVSFICVRANGAR